MTAQACPYCGSSRVLQSPSGRHLLCAECHRVVIQPRIKKTRGRRPRTRAAAPAPRKFDSLQA